ncbi:PREDICTED: protein ANTI-SILENCING 1 isoform X2 [Nicotiana attenuata]|uniref:protein ANTI-SILENCING 1 isoform X2 n=1 Tax=Nicotiana attenuata TaxID=49451 RepID=UPI0009057065|nr:PREDICTED: protein ANTI-SILENCING 1 isoform X2 [Nicotiana attenuata]
MASVETVKVEPSADLENEEEVKFVWGRKRGIGGKRKEVQFYESFTYDDVEYALYDCVYMHKEGQLPYIGKIIKIWENPDKSRKIKVHWFFRPSEILYHLKGVEVAAENEIFLASGEGTGLANVNPLEAIAGKCNVVCTSEDNRNPQPSEEEVKLADFVFYRAFDVGKCSILDKMDDKVGGLDVKYVFNRKESQKASHVLKHASDQNGDKNTVEYQATTKESFGLKALNDLGTSKASHLDGKIDVDAQSSLVRQDALQRETNVSRVNKETTKKANSAPGEQNSDDVSRVPKAAGKLSHIVGKSDVNVQTSPVRQDRLHRDANDSGVKQQSTMKGNPAPVQIVNSTATTVVQNTISEENARCKIKNEKDDKKVNKPPINLVEAGETGKSPKDLGVLEDRPSKRIKVNGSVTLSEDKGVNSVEKSTVCRNGKKVLGTSAVPSEERKKSVDSKLSGGLDKNMKIRKDSAALDSRPSKKANIDARKVQEDRDKSNMLGKCADNLGKLPKLSTGTSPKEVERTEGKSFEVTRRPVAESSKWFKAPDIIWHACRENCTTKMVQRTAFSSPYSGRALVAFKTREGAERVTKKLADGCLMVSSQRPLVASFVSLPKTEGNASSLAGHLCVDKLRLQLQREMREAVSTSHCSQPNTIEYEMANEWRLLQARSDSWWNRLYKQQKEDLTKIASGLKRK